VGDDPASGRRADSGRRVDASSRADCGQLVWIGFEGTRAPAELLHRLDAGRAGATILFKRNLEFVGDACDLDALVELNRSLHRAAPDGTPALIAVDQEGGRVQRVKSPATVWPPMLAFEAITSGDDALAEDVGRALGGELAALGFDIDFAPVLDVHTNAANPIIGDRAFGTTADAVARRALAFARGLAAAGIVACGKHFPGHGDTSTDSHLELPRIDHDWARLERVELLPFRAAAVAKLPMIMTAHVVFAAIDATGPATLSHSVITGLLRNRLHYEGVIVSDDLDMKAIKDPATAAVDAVRAGCDVLLLCKDPAAQQGAEEALIRECERESAFRARVGEAADRVRAMKRVRASQTATSSRDLVGAAAHRALSRRLAGG
jgi:beta-N-acetylhexosaminidase